MILFRLMKSSRSIDLSVDEIVPDMGSLLDRSSASIANMLDRFRGDEVALEREIADLTERLRQTRVAITAFEAAGAFIVGGKQSPVIATDPDKVGRLVPRGHGSMRAMADADSPIVHVHKDIRA